MYHNVYWLYIGDYQNGHATGVALGVVVEVAGYRFMVKTSTIWDITPVTMAIIIHLFHWNCTSKQ